MAPILIALLLIGGGTSLAAKSAVPGSALYPVKVDFNENLHSSFDLSSESKAQWDATLESRRLSEAETLASQGKLTASTEADLKTRFNAEAQDYSVQMAKINATGKGSASAVETASNLQGSLAAHAQVLSQFSASANAGQVADLMAAVNTEAGTVSNNQNTLEASFMADTSAATQATAQSRQAAAQSSINSANAYMTSLSANGSANAVAAATANISLATQAYDQGTASYAAGNYGDAFVQFENAMRIAGQAQTTLSIGQKLNLGANGMTQDGATGSASGDMNAASGSNTGTSSDSNGSVSGGVSVGANATGGASSGSNASGNAGVNVNTGGAVNLNLGK